jgi:hypothetical protein
MTHKLATLFHTALWQFVPSLTRKETTTMRIRSARIRGFVLATLLLGIVTAAPMASAGEWTDESGTICKNYNAGEVSYIDYFPSGTRIVTKTSPTYVICPVARNTTGTNGAYFYVNVTGTTQTTYCTAYSYNLYGQYKASSSSSGTGLIGINLYNATSGVNSDALSNYSVLCYLPGSGSGAVLSTVDLYEY